MKTKGDLYNMGRSDAQRGLPRVKSTPGWRTDAYNEGYDEGLLLRSSEAVDKSLKEVRARLVERKLPALNGKLMDPATLVRMLTALVDTAFDQASAAFRLHPDEDSVAALASTSEAYLYWFHLSDEDRTKNAQVVDEAGIGVGHIVRHLSECASRKRAMPE